MKGLLTFIDYIENKKDKVIRIEFLNFFYRNA